MKIADVIEKLVRKVKKQDDLDIEKEIEDLLADEEIPEESVPDEEPELESVPDEEPELESEGGWIQAIEDADDEDDGASLEDEPQKIGKDDEESDDWILQDDNKTDLQAFASGGSGGSCETAADTLLTELKMDDDLRDHEETEIMEYLEVVGADELVDEMRSTIAKMEGGKK
jgi:thioredoxin-like negative regulator of GroEL